MATHRDKTYSGEAYPFDKRVKETITVSSGYGGGGGEDARISFNIDGNVVVLNGKTMRSLIADVNRRLQWGEPRRNHHARRDAQVFAFPPGIFRDSNYTSD